MRPPTFRLTDHAINANCGRMRIVGTQHWLTRQSTLTLIAVLALLTRAAIASPAAETFGPGTVNCQHLMGIQVDCLLAASRITQGNRNVAAFTVETLPRGERALFRKWCLTTADDCDVTLTGRRTSPQSTRLSTVMSVRWTRPGSPVNQAAARALEQASSTNTAGSVLRPVP